MRKGWLALVGALALVAGAFGAPAVGAAPAEHSGDRILAAFATFADPADCADGACDAVYLTVAQGVLETAAGPMRVDGIVLVDVYPSTVTDEGLFPVGPPMLSGCTMAVDVAIAQNLRTASAVTRGTVGLREFVSRDDGTVACTEPIGHALNLRAGFSGVGVTFSSASHGQYADPWTHNVNRYTERVRMATAEVTGTLDGVPLALPWPDSASLLRTASRTLAVTHRIAVGPVVRGPLHVAAHAELISIGSGSAGDWGVDAMVMRSPDGSGKTYLGVSGVIDEEFCWGDGEPASIVLAGDVSAGTAEGTLMVYCGETGEEYGEVHVSATWTGDGDAWRFRNTGVFRSPDGHGTTLVSGIHRAATLTLVVDGVALAQGSGYLEAFTIK